MDSLAGKLLIATPKLGDPNFVRSVVLIIAHDENGAFGVVLNRPLEGLAVVPDIPGWSESGVPPPHLHRGGPVDPTVAIGLGRAGASPPAPGWTPVFDGVGLVDLGRPHDELEVHVTDLRVFVGYAGWGAGQLDGEVEQDAWFVASAMAEDVFAAEPEALWPAVLRRQGPRVAIYATFPEDPGRN
jgi:putative transcriptional regulator